jgi:3-oxoadipate enol-lactonase
LVAATLATALKATAPEGYIGCCQALRDADLSRQIERVKAPALIIAGTEDQATTMASARFLQRKIRGSQLVALECAHLACVEAASGFTDHLNRFLTETNKLK